MFSQSDNELANSPRLLSSLVWMSNIWHDKNRLSFTCAPLPVARRSTGYDQGQWPLPVRPIPIPVVSRFTILQQKRHISPGIDDRSWMIAHLDWFRFLLQNIRQREPSISMWHLLPILYSIPKPTLWWGAVHNHSRYQPTHWWCGYSSPVWLSRHWDYGYTKTKC